MTLNINLPSDVEQGLLAKAQTLGLSLADFAEEVLTREAKPQEPRRRTGQEIIDACARVRGLADELEAARNPSPSRSVDFS